MVLRLSVSKQEYHSFVRKYSLSTKNFVKAGNLTKIFQRYGRILKGHSIESEMHKTLCNYGGWMKLSQDCVQFCPRWYQVC